MLKKEVTDHLTLLATISPDRRYSLQLLEFLAKRYELSPEELEEAKLFMGEKGITLYDEFEEAGPYQDEPGKKEEDQEEPKKKRKGLFGRRK